MNGMTRGKLIKLANLQAFERKKEDTQFNMSDASLIKCKSYENLN